MNYESEIERSCQDFNLFRKRGLLLWLARTQSDHYDSKCERKSGEFICLSITKANAKTNLQIFICNHFCVDGKGYFLKVASKILWTAYAGGSLSSRFYFPLKPSPIKKGDKLKGRNGAKVAEFFFGGGVSDFADFLFFSQVCILGAL